MAVWTTLKPTTDSKLATLVRPRALRLDGAESWLDQTDHVCTQLLRLAGVTVYYRETLYVKGQTLTLRTLSNVIKHLVISL